MSVLRYKGYAGTVEVDLEAGILYGRVLDIRDTITFQSPNVEDIRREFARSIDEYLAFCAEIKRNPEQPYSGKLSFRTSPEHHSRIAHAAHLGDMSINTFVEQAAIREAARVLQEPMQPYAMHEIAVPAQEAGVDA